MRLGTAALSCFAAVPKASLDSASDAVSVSSPPDEVVLHDRVSCSAMSLATMGAGARAAVELEGAPSGTWPDGSHAAAAV